MVQFTVQMSANQGILPFGSAQKAAVSNATQALFAPLYGEACSADGRSWMSWAMLKIILEIIHTCKDNEKNCVNAGSNAAQVTSVDVTSSGSTSNGIQAVTAKVGVSIP